MKVIIILTAALALLLAPVTKGWIIYGHEVRTGRAKVEKWLERLGN